MTPDKDVQPEAAEPSAEEWHEADHQIARAVEQARALRETLCEEKDLLGLVDVLLLELGARVAWRKA